MNYIDKLVPPENRDRKSENIFNVLEINLYLVDRAKNENSNRALDALERLRDNLKNNQETPHTPFLSEQTQKSDTQRIENLFTFLDQYHGSGIFFDRNSKELITYLAEMIELSQSFMRA